MCASTRDLHGDANGASTLIGMILVLGIGVAGISAAVVVGAPILQGLQDQAALAGAMGQFEELRSRVDRLAVAEATGAVSLQPNGGQLAVQRGSLIAVTILHDMDFAGCDMRVRDWTDGDDTLQFKFVSGACASPGADTRVFLPECDVQPILGIPTGDLLDLRSCVRAERLAGERTPVAVAAVSVDGTNVQFAEAIDPRSIWRVWLTDNDNETRLEFILFQADRAQWVRSSSAGGARVVYEAGALFARRDGPLSQSWAPPFDEAGGGASDPLFLRFPLLRAETTAGVRGGAPHELHLAHAEADAVVRQAAATSVRVEFAGELAERWCASMLVRNADLASNAYAAQPDLSLALGGADTGHQCNPSQPNADGIRGVVYDPGGASFPTSVTVQVIDVRLLQ